MMMLSIISLGKQGLFRIKELRLTVVFVPLSRKEDYFLRINRDTYRLCIGHAPREMKH